MSPLAWFLAGGFSALFVARLVSRWLRRLFWPLVAAAFAVWALFAVPGAHRPPSAAGAFQRPAQAVWRALLQAIGK